MLYVHIIYKEIIYIYIYNMHYYYYIHTYMHYKYLIYKLQCEFVFYYSLRVDSVDQPKGTILHFIAFT